MIFSLVSIGLMIVELLSAELLFSKFMKKRSMFLLRFIGCVILIFTISFFAIFIFSVVNDRDFNYNGTNELIDSLFKFFLYVGIFMMTAFTFKYSFDESMRTILFYCSGGYALQHICWNINVFINLIPSADVYFSGNPYMVFLPELGLCLVIYTLIYFLLIKNRTRPDLIKDLNNKVFLFIMVLLVCILITRFTSDVKETNLYTKIGEVAGAILNCTFILIFLFDMTDKDKAKNEVEVLKSIMKREKEQYKLTKENIEIINLKCHDLKHQIQALRNNASEKHIKQIEDAVMFFDSSYKTGNDVLDVILTDKSLLCEQNNITFTCIVKGEELSFMDEMDIYSLFGNAISNAFERVSTIKGKDKRCISLNVRKEGYSLSIHIENFYEGEIKFENGLPTTDKDKDYHGYGMKSMNYIAHKYNGYMNVSTEDNIFSVDFIIPLPETDKEIK